MFTTLQLWYTGNNDFSHGKRRFVGAFSLTICRVQHSIRHFNTLCEFLSSAVFHQISLFFYRKNIKSPDFKSLRLTVLHGTFGYLPNAVHLGSVTWLTVWLHDVKFCDLLLSPYTLLFIRNLPFCLGLNVSKLSRS